MRLLVIRPALPLVVLMTVGACLAGCAPLESSAESTMVANGPSSADATIGPVGLDETVTVGPYKIAILKAQVLADPQPGPDMASVPPVPEGFELAHFRVAVHNPASSSETTMVSMDAFGLHDENGLQFPLAGTGLSRSEPPGTDDPYSMGPGEIVSAPIRPGETIWLEPQFLVPEGSRVLTFTYAPLGGRPRPVVVFRLD